MAIDTQQLSKLGAFVKGQLDSYINDRAYLERQCLKNLRQYRRKYDPEVLNLIAPDKSQSYPGDTRIKVLKIQIQYCFSNIKNYTEV